MINTSNYILTSDNENGKQSEDATASLIFKENIAQTLLSELDPISSFRLIKAIREGDPLLENFIRQQQLTECLDFLEKEGIPSSWGIELLPLLQYLEKGGELGE